MGMTKVKLIIKNPRRPSRRFEEDFLVDSGAHYTVLPESLVKSLGLRPSFEQEFSLADGTVVKRPVGSALVVFENKELAVPVVLGEKDDSPLLGVTTLESFGLMIDPFKRKIYHSKILLA